MFRPRTGFLILFFATVIVAGIASLPLAFVMKVTNAPIIAQRVDGTIWNGSIKNAWVAGYPAGDIEVSGQLVPLLMGQAAADIRIRGAIATGRASIAINPVKIRFNRTDMAVNLAPLQLKDAFGAPMSGLVRVKSESLVISRTECVSGDVSVSTDTLQNTAKRYGGEGFALSGQGGCENGAFILPLSGQGQEGVADAVVRVSADGYTTELTIAPSDLALANALQLYGFQKRGDTYNLIQRGELF